MNKMEHWNKIKTKRSIDDKIYSVFVVAEKID
jgi:hypothetical protein